MSQPRFTTETVAIDDPDGTSMLQVRGSVTFGEVAELRRRILDEVGRITDPRLVLELAGIEQIDSAGAAVLVEAFSLGRKQGKQVILCSPSESVMRLFRLSGLQDVLDACCSTQEETRERLLQGSA